MRVYPNWQMNLILENGGRKSFSMKPKHNIIYTKEENVFMVPNQENKGDYYMSPCLS